METLTKSKKAFAGKPQIRKVIIRPNYRWTDRWLEQTNEVSNKVKTLVADNSMDDFCFYVDAMQAN